MTALEQLMLSGMAGISARDLSGDSQALGGIGMEI